MSGIEQTSSYQRLLSQVNVIPPTTGSLLNTDATAYQTISQTYVTQSTPAYVQSSAGASSTESITPISVSSVSSSVSSSAVVSSPTQPLPDQLFSSLNGSLVISSTSVRSSINVTSFVVPATSEISSVAATSSYSVLGTRSITYLDSSDSPEVTSISGSSSEKSLLVSEISSSVSTTPPLQTSHSGPPASSSLRLLPPPSISDRATTVTASSTTATESLTSSWGTATSSISPSSTLSSLFTSATATSSVILSTPATTSRKPIYNTTFELPEPAFKTESLYIVIPVCLVVLLMLAILITMCLRWRKHVKKVYEEPPPDLWVNAHTEMAILPPASSSTASAIPVDNIAPFVPGDAICVVIHPFPAQLDSQMSLRAGEVVKVLDKEENGWWRGVNQTGQSGWFPGSYVETARYVPNLSDGKKKSSRVSSFLLKKKNYFPYKDQSPDNTNSLDRAHNSQEGQLQTDKMTSAQLQNNKIENGTKYYAVYSYTAASKGEIDLREGEVVTGYERDRNGWMRGRRVTSGEEGWFPAVYVEEIHDTASMSSESTISGPVGYDQLTRNRNYHTNQDWVGLEHRACYSYVGKIGQDLSFEAGDKIIIYEILDNGWWLGSKGKNVGWLPGTYVQLLEPLTDDEARSDSSSEDKFRNSSEDLVRSDDDDSKPKPSRRAPLPPTHQISPSVTLDRHTLPAIPTLDVQVNKGQTIDTDKATNTNYRPIKFQRLSSDRVTPLRPAPSPPGQRGSAEHVDKNIHKIDNTEPPKSNSLPEFKPPSPENFVTVKVSLPSKTCMTSEKLFYGKNPEVPKRFAKPKLYIRRKSTKLANLVIHSKPSRPCPSRPPQPVFSHRYRKKNKSIEYSLLDEETRSTNTDLMTNGITLNSDQPQISYPTLPPDIVLSSSGDAQITPTKQAPSRPLPLPPSPEELKSLTKSPSDESLKSSTLQESELNVQFKPRRVIKVPPPIVPRLKLDTGTNSTSENVANSKTENKVIPTHSEEENNLRNKTFVEENHFNEMEENKNQNTTGTSVTIPESGSSNDHPLPNDSNSTDTHSTSNKEHSSVENGQSSETETEQNAVLNKPKYKAPPVKPPPPKSPPPKVQRLVRNMEAADRSKTTTLWRAKRNYSAAAKGELSFEEGTFIKEISKALGHPGWCVGMLADGTTGLYHQSYVEESLVKEQTHI